MQLSFIYQLQALVCDAPSLRESATLCLRKTTSLEIEVRATHPEVDMFSTEAADSWRNFFDIFFGNLGQVITTSVLNVAHGIWTLFD